MRPKVVIANWKMNGSSSFVNEMASSLNEQSDLGNTDQVAICPPAVYIQQLLAGLQSKIGVGAQNLSDQDEGAYTGEISAGMLVDLGCKWVLVGHSERREYFSETDELVANKALAALKAGLKTVVCIGETLDERRAGLANQVVERQLAPLLNHRLADYAGQLLFAYEPVWAIGTGETATPEQAQEIHAYIRSLLPEELKGSAILYGGSVKPENAAELFTQQDIDGGLIGGASLIAEDFIQICRAMP